MNTNMLNLDVFKRTRSIDAAEREQRAFEWQVKTQIEFISQGRISDAEDLLRAGLLIKENRTTDKERKHFDRVLAEVGRRGYKDAERELRWRLQRYLTIEEEERK